MTGEPALPLIFPLAEYGAFQQTPDLIGGAKKVPEWVPNGAAFFIDFENDRAFFGGRIFHTIGSLLASPLAAFTRASSGLYLQASGAYTSFNSDEPRLGDKGVLIERAATNLAPFSDDASQWSVKDNVRVVGRSNIFESAATNYHRVGASSVISSTVGKPITVSFDVEANGRNFVGIRTNLTNASDYVTNGLDLASGTVTYQEPNAVARIDRLGGTNVYKISVTITPTANGTCSVFLLMANSTITDSGLPRYVGDENRGIIAHNIQVENGSSATSPILTRASAAVRAADAFRLMPRIGVYDIVVTFDNGSTQTFPSQSVPESGWTIPTGLDRNYIKKISGALS